MNVSRFMEKWGREVFNKFREKVKAQKEIIAGLINRTDEASSNLFLLEQAKLNDLLFHEEIYWKQRAKTFCLQEGNAKTRFFHSSTTSRKKTNHISFLHSESGDRVYRHEDMCKIVKEYYSNIFGASTEVDLGYSGVARTVTEAQNRGLIVEMSFEEISLVVSQMHPDKASGPNGLNPAFFQHFWSSMGMEVYECCKTWLQNCSSPTEFNNTNLVLIPKKAGASCMKDFRPIVLFNVLYNILAKVLANRLKSILSKLISENQSTFVPRRSITDNVLIAFEVIHHMRRKTGGRDGEVALKLDISKAYDRVDRNFLKHRMSCMCFCTRWINWVMMCVTTISYEVCFNGSSIGPITPQRGLRQGDPLSPYLFLLCVEGLSDSLNQAASRGSIQGCQISPTAPVITHLLFADDSFLFFKANIEETVAVKGLLNMYEKSLGQSVNFKKSGMLLSSNVRRDKLKELLDILEVTNGIDDSRYLGLPSLIGRSKKKVFGFIKDKVWKRIQGWKAKPLVTDPYYHY